MDSAMESAANPPPKDYTLEEQLDSYSQTAASSAPPPPPPPPPRLLDTSKTVNSQIVTWMVKSLS